MDGKGRRKYTVINKNQDQSRTKGGNAFNQVHQTCLKAVSQPTVVKTCFHCSNNYEEWSSLSKVGQLVVGQLDVALSCEGEGPVCALRERCCNGGAGGRHEDAGVLLSLDAQLTNPFVV